MCETQLRERLDKLSGAQTKEETNCNHKNPEREEPLLLIYMSCAHRRAHLLHLWWFGQPIGHALLRHLLPHLLRKPVCRGRENFGAATRRVSFLPKVVRQVGCEREVGRQIAPHVRGHDTACDMRVRIPVHAVDPAVRELVGADVRALLASLL